MLVSLLRLLLLFEFVVYLFGAGLLIRLANWRVPAVLLLILSLACVMRISLVGMLHLLDYVHRPSVAGYVPWRAGRLCRSLLRECGVIFCLEWVCAFPSLAVGKDVRCARSPETGVSPAPFLLVHGYACNRGIWWWMKPRLEAHGRRVATVTLEPLQGDIDGYAGQIAQRVAWLRAQLGVERVILVGYGMGGLACLAYLRRYGEDYVEQLCTLGTPHSGTALWRPGWGRNLDQMCTGSTWLSGLAGFFDEMPLVIPSVVLHGLHDPCMIPPRTARMTGAIHHAWAEMGHLEMLVSHRVLAALLKLRG